MNKKLKDYLKGCEFLLYDGSQIFYITDVRIVNNVVHMDTAKKISKWECTLFKGKPKELKEFLDNLIK